MNIQIHIECDRIDELTTHLQVLKEQVRRYAKKHGLDLADEISEGVIMQDDNCYGVHYLEVMGDEMENPFWLSGDELEKAVSQAKQC